RKLGSDPLQHLVAVVVVEGDRGKSATGDRHEQLAHRRGHRGDRDVHQPVGGRLLAEPRGRLPRRDVCLGLGDLRRTAHPISPFWPFKLFSPWYALARTVSGLHPISSAVSATVSPSTWRYVTASRCRGGSSST